jgi:predicted dehydrogenase
MKGCCASGGRMRIGIVGCGFTADLYMPSIKIYPNLELVAATDINQDRAQQFCKCYSVNFSPTLESMLADSSIEMVVNLTSSSSHFEVTKECLEAGKHVYSEKPLSPNFSNAQALVELATAKGLYLSAAPCGLLGETAQTLWRALRKNEIGTVRVVYADLDDGPLHLAEPHTWRSRSGAPYDYAAEFNTGVTVEHTCYYLSWFAAFFGPAKTISAFSSCQWPDKRVSPEETLRVTTPDFSVACITYDSGIVVRLTCGLVAPYNHVMKIVGDTGVFTVEECWNLSSPVYLDRYSQYKFKAERYPITKRLPFIANIRDRGSRIYRSVRQANWFKKNHRYRPDFARGVAELAQAVTEKRRPRLPSDFCLHVNELSVAIQNPTGTPYQVRTTFAPLQPLDDVELQQLIAKKW